MENSSTNYNCSTNYYTTSNIPAIYLQSKKEWKKRKEILQDTIDAISREIPTMETLDSVRETNIADVDKVYAQYETEMIKARRKSIGPERYNLGEFDVNLRQYKIIGGVFSIDYLEQPHQDRRLNSKSFIRNGRIGFVV